MLVQWTERVDLQVEVMIVFSERREFIPSGKLLTKDALAHFSCEGVKVVLKESESKIVGNLIGPRLPLV